MRKIFKVEPEGGCFLRHKWVYVADKDGNQYFECRKCGAKKIYHDTETSGNVRFSWLEGRTNIIKSAPKKDNGQQ